MSSPIITEAMPREGWKRPSYLTEEEYAKCLLLGVMIHRSKLDGYFIATRTPKENDPFNLGTLVLRKAGPPKGDTYGMRSWVRCDTVSDILDAVINADKYGYEWR